jgi:hypothetical protein
MTSATLDEALKRLSSRRSDVRERGVKQLEELGRTDLLLEMALDPDVYDPFLIRWACEYHFPEPSALLVRDLVQARGPDAPLGFRYKLPKANYLYAEDAIITALRPRLSQLPIQTIEGLGLAYYRSVAPKLEKYLKGNIENLADAIANRGPKARGGVVQFVNQPDHLCWSGEAMRVFVAAVALHRLDHPISLERAKQILADVEVAMDECYTKRIIIQQFHWILFELGQISLEDLLTKDSRNYTIEDIGSTLLKHGRDADAAKLLGGAHSVDRIESGGFAHWPLMDFMESIGVENWRARRQHPASTWFGYVRGRKYAMAPPSWWSWRTDS